MCRFLLLDGALEVSKSADAYALRESLPFRAFLPRRQLWHVDSTFDRFGYLCGPPNSRLQLTPMPPIYSDAQKEWAARGTNTASHSPTPIIVPRAAGTVSTTNQSAAHKHKRRQNACSRFIEGATCFAGAPAQCHVYVLQLMIAVLWVAHVSARASAQRQRQRPPHQLHAPRQLQRAIKTLALPAQHSGVARYCCWSSFNINFTLTDCCEYR